ncbi:hypothetical protein O3M35_000955 [Rhynocoris fuscipes]|uniref:Uncharacterized protein n=1 Tax=Rhynocoris fuscipes TaxID=488301 RepID=A0AAW1DQM6_9HEMI
METRDIDGSVRGSYSYIDPNGNIVKMQYWDDGSGFHAAGNNIPVAIHQAPEFTPEVKAAREQHLRLYEAALSALKAAADSQENEKDDASYIDTSHYEGGDEYEDAPPEGGVIIENPAPPSSVYADSLLSAEYPKLQHNQNNHINDNSYYSDEDKESVSVENPELRRRLLLRKDKEQDNNDSTKNKEHEPSSESDKDQASASVDENGSNKQSSEQSANGRAFYYHFTHTIPKPVERVDLSEETKHVAEPLSQSAKAQHYGSIPVAGVHDVQLSPAQRNALSNFQLYPVYHSQQN